MMKKKILVTGASGQLGKTIEELYAKNELGLEFTFADKNILDITNKEYVRVFFKNGGFNYCINCAAYTNVEQAEKTPEIAFKINADGVKNIAEACYNHDVVLIHISTDYVFDGEKEEAYTVEDIPYPINEYGKSKLQGEKYVQDILSEYFIVRTSWLYSRKYGNNFYKTILKKATNGEDLSITTEQKGCPTDTVNLSKFIVSLIQDKNNSFGVYHYCDEKVMTWYEFAKYILKENNQLNNIKLVKANNYRTFARRPKNSVLKSLKY